jgi:hypothetical protein
MKKKHNLALIGLLGLVLVSLSLILFFLGERRSDRDLAAVAATVTSPFHYAFKVDGILQEVGYMNESTSPYWWLNSGGYMYLRDGIGMTIQGDLPVNDPRRIYYEKYNSETTDYGYHPQNLFRLITRSKWQDFRQEVYFRITDYHVTDSGHRGGDNGLLLFSHYIDQDNLYYSGIRVDGTVVVKKKKAQQYYIIKNKPFFPGKYNRDTNPILIPKNTWIGIRSEVLNLPDGSVVIRLYVDVGRTGKWILALSALDDGKNYGGTAIRERAYAGIRTDFMDVLFDDYRITLISENI